MAQIKGLNSVLKNLEKFGKEAENEIEDALIKSSANIELDVKRLVSENLGKLQQSIGGEQLDKLNYIVFAGGILAPYAPYQEFGTGSAVDLSYLTEAEYPSSYASQFRGQGKRKVNLPAQPFLFPALIINRGELIKDLKQSLKRLINKYN